MKNNINTMTLQGIAQAIAIDMQVLRQYQDRTPEEVELLGKHIPFRILKDYTQFVSWAHAIDLNPKVQQDYYTALQDEQERLQQQEQAEMAAQLAEKFKVTKL